MTKVKVGSYIVRPSGTTWLVEDVDPDGKACGVTCPFTGGHRIEVDALPTEGDIVFPTKEAALAYARIMGIRLH